jgi:hypothetical protein
MGYGSDTTVFVEDAAGDLGASPSPAPWWLSPDIEILGHPGEAVQGPNQVQVRVHSHESPTINDRILGEVYVGLPSLVMSPSMNTVRIDPIDPNMLIFRPPNLAGTEPIADVAGGTLTFEWTPTANAANPNGPGHRCLVLRAFPAEVVPPDVPFTVPNEQHEAQRNIEILTTTTASAPIGAGGNGTRDDPRGRDEETGMWWERFATLGVGPKRRPRFVVWAFDPEPDERLVADVRASLGKGELSGFSSRPPKATTLEPVGARGKQIDPQELLSNRQFAKRSGLGRGLFAKERLLSAASLQLGPRDEGAGILLRFDHSNLRRRGAVVLHGAQWNEDGDPEGGITVVARAPLDG